MIFLGDLNSYTPSIIGKDKDLRFIIENPALRFQLETRLKEVCKDTFDYKLNREIIIIKQVDFLKLLKHIAAEKKCDEKLKKKLEEEYKEVKGSWGIDEIIDYINKHPLETVEAIIGISLSIIK